MIRQNVIFAHQAPCSESFARGTVLVYVGGVLYPATDALLAANGGNWAGIALTPSHTGAKTCTVQQFGFVPEDITGLGDGAAGTVYVVDGVISRSVSSYECGHCDIKGNVVLSRGTATGSSFFGTADTVLRQNAGNTAYEWAFVTNSNVDAAAAIQGTKTVPHFGAQNVITTGHWEPQYTTPGTPSGSVASTGLIRLRSQETDFIARNNTNTGDMNVMGFSSMVNPYSLDAWYFGDYGYWPTSTYTQSIKLRFPSGVKLNGPLVHFRDINTTFGVCNEFYVVPAGTTNWNWREGTTPIIKQANTASATGAEFLVYAQDGATTGGSVRVAGGTGATEAARGAVQLKGQIRGRVGSSMPFRLGVADASFTSDANLTLSGAAVYSPAIRASSVGSLTAQRNLVLPVLRGALYCIKNSTTGGQSIQAIGASGTGHVIANGASAWVYCDGTNYVAITGGTGSTGANGTNGTNGIGFFETTYTSNTTYSVPSTCTRVDVLLISGGGGGAGGGGGGAGVGVPPNDGYDGGAGAGGGGAGAPAEHVFIPLYPVTPLGSVSLTVGPGGTGGGGGAGGTGGVATPSGDGTNGTNGTNGVASVFGVVSVAGGVGGTGGTGGGAYQIGGETYGGGTPGAGGAGSGSGGTGGGGTVVAPPGNNGTNTTGTTSTNIATRTPYGSSGVGFFNGTLTGATNATGGTYNSSSSAGTGGGGGAGASPTTLRWHPYQGSVTAGVGGAGGNGGGLSAATSGAAGTASTHAGLGGAGGGGGGGGGGVPADGGTGGAGGNGAQGRVIIRGFEICQEA